MLTRDEIDFLKAQGLSPADVYDGRGQSSAAWKAGVRSAGKTVVLGSPCSSKGHRLRTRSGHCAQCDTAKLSYQKRHNTEGYIYIAGSKAARLLKVGTCVDIEQRRRNLRNQMYGGISDWEMLFTAKVEAGGKVEGDALARLSKFKVVRMYEKDGKKQEAAEMLKTSFSVALSVVQESLKATKATEIRKALKTSDYEFK
ncbi:GIY-YIG nuclease family protein [Shinella sp.]|uniref:GIY-YIG nuclease family protein n=1 Tax=Shinella sp. TaxID=1870904 RepID=UPI0039E43AF8